MMQQLNYPKEYLNLHRTLMCGQAFRWKHDHDGWWSATVRGKVIRIKEADQGFLWGTLPGDPDERLLFDYFRLEDDVPGIYRYLSDADVYLKSVIERLSGLRIVRQDPEETLLSFVCSTANSVPRISKAIEELSRKYGHFIAEIGGREHYSFPSAEAFATADPDDLAKTGGLAWRGPNIAMVAKQLLSHPSDWLESLRSAEYEYAKSELMTLRGIGAKIADCVCLFSLDKDQAVPVDTHIRQVAERLFMPEMKTKTVTPAGYNRIVKAFWEKYGHYAGWAQEFLYYEDLLKARKRHAVPLAR
jgi:N-glycosylase/DNA lyase